jgi:hypothetical protein
VMLMLGFGETARRGGGGAMEAQAGSRASSMARMQARESRDGLGIAVLNPTWEEAPAEQAREELCSPPPPPPPPPSAAAAASSSASAAASWKEAPPWMEARRWLCGLRRGTHGPARETGSSRRKETDFWGRRPTNLTNSVL